MRANRYLFNHWMKHTGERSTAKILLAHEVPKEALMEAFRDEVNFENCWEDVTADKFFLTLSPLQEADVLSVGWLYGSSYTTNRVNLGTAINATPQLTLNRLTVELRVKHIQSYPREKVEQAARVSAVHVFCAKSKYLQTQKALHNLYNKKRKFNFPEEKRFQFVPDMSSDSSTISRDVKAVATHEAFKEQQAVHLRSIDRIYLTNVMREPTTNLAHFYQYNLHAVLMGLVDKRTPEQPIFLGLDQSPDNPAVWILTTQADQYQEACEVAQKLGVLVSHQMGDLVWDTWFTSEYRQLQSAAFLWDPTRGKYVARASEMMSDLRNTTLFRNLYELPKEQETPCVITNLSILLPGAFRTRSTLVNVDGNSSATSVRDKQDVLTSVYSVDPIDNLDFEYLNDEPEVELLGNAVKSNAQWYGLPPPTTQASLTTKAKPDVVMADSQATGTTPSLAVAGDSKNPIPLDLAPSDGSAVSGAADEEMQDGDQAPLPMRSFAHILQQLESDPTPVEYLAGYPGTVEAIQLHFDRWYAECDQKDFYPSKATQLQMLTTSIAAFHIDPEPFFSNVPNYETAVYYLSKAWIWFRKEDIASTLHIPFSYYDSMLDKEVFEQHRDDWFQDDERILDRDMIMEFISFDAIELQMSVGERANEFARGSLRDLAACQHSHFQVQLNQQSDPNYLADAFPILRPTAEDEPG